MYITELGKTGTILASAGAGVIGCIIALIIMALCYKYFPEDPCCQLRKPKPKKPKKVKVKPTEGAPAAEGAAEGGEGGEEAPKKKKKEKKEKTKKEEPKDEAKV